MALLACMLFPFRRSSHVPVEVVVARLQKRVEEVALLVLFLVEHVLQKPFNAPALLLNGRQAERGWRKGGEASAAAGVSMLRRGSQR